jgi:hypothetical protein
MGRSTMLELVACPDPACGTVAEIVDTVTLDSTGGPVETVRTRCLYRHTFVLPADRLSRREREPLRPK